MTFDPFSGTADSLTAPARNPFAIVPHATDDLPVCPKAIYVGTGGTVVLRAVDGETDVTFVNVPSGSIVPVRARAVRNTGTASDLVGLA